MPEQSCSCPSHPAERALRLACAPYIRGPRVPVGSSEGYSDGARILVSRTNAEYVQGGGFSRVSDQDGLVTGPGQPYGQAWGVHVAPCRPPRVASSSGRRMDGRDLVAFAGSRTASVPVEQRLTPAGPAGVDGDHMDAVGDLDDGRPTPPAPMTTCAHQVHCPKQPS
jgi:hypothetical protein